MMAWTIYGLHLADFFGNWWIFLIVAANAWKARPLQHEAECASLFGGAL
jgi:hypothetical protein